MPGCRLIENLQMLRSGAREEVMMGGNIQDFGCGDRI